MSAAHTVSQVLAQAVATLRAAGIEAPAQDARLLLADALGVEAGRLTLHLPEPMPEGAAARLSASLAARARRQPVAQILRARLFWGRRFEVTGDTLDPRPETETLIAAALRRPFARLLDLGTGTGCIAITLLAERPGARGLAVDLSPPALRVAGRNAATHDVAGRLELSLSDWWAGVAGRFDLIVSNPPYIAEAEMAGLAPEVRDWEPALALTDGGDGLGAYREILSRAGDHLSPGGAVMVEIGLGQAPAVAALGQGAGLGAPEIVADIDGRARVLIFAPG